MTYYISSQSSCNVRESAIFHITKKLVSLSKPADLSSWSQGFSLTHFPPKNTRKKQKKFWFLFTSDGQNWSSGATHMRNLTSPMELIMKTLAESKKKKKKKLWASPILPRLFFFLFGPWMLQTRAENHRCYSGGENSVCSNCSYRQKKQSIGKKLWRRRRRKLTKISKTKIIPHKGISVHNRLQLFANCNWKRRRENEIVAHCGRAQERAAKQIRPKLRSGKKIQRTLD